MPLNETVNEMLIRIRAQVMGTAQAQQQVTTLTNQLTASARSAKKEFEQMAGAYTAVLVGRRGLMAVGALIAPAVQAEAALAKLRVQTGALDAEMAVMTSAAGRAAAATAFGFTDAVEGLTELKRAGFTAKSAVDALMPTMIFAQVRGVAVADAARAAGFMFKAWGAEGLSIQRGMTALHTIAQKTGFQIKNLDDVLAKLASTTHMSGLSFEQTIPIFGLVARSEGSVERAATGVQRLMNDLQNPARQGALRKVFGVETLDRGRLRDVLDIAADVASKIDNMHTAGAAFQRLGFEQRSRRSFEALVGTLEHGIDAYRDINGQMVTGHKLAALLRADAAGLGEGLDTAAKIMLGTFLGSWERMSGATNVLLTKIFLPILPHLSSLVEILADAVEGAVEFLDTHKGWATFVSLVVGAGTALLAIGSTVAVVMGSMRILSVTISFTTEMMMKGRAAAVAQATALQQLTAASTNAAAAQRMMGASAAVGNRIVAGPGSLPGFVPTAMGRGFGANAGAATSAALRTAPVYGPMQPSIIGPGPTPFPGTVRLASAGANMAGSLAGTAGVMRQVEARAVSLGSNITGLGDITARYTATTGRLAQAYRGLNVNMMSVMQSAVILGMAVEGAQQIQEIIVQHGPATSAAIVRETRDRGLLGSAVAAVSEAYYTYTDAGEAALSLQEQQVEATKELTEAQTDLNAALQAYRDVLDKAAKFKFPPTVMASDVRRVADEVERLRNIGPYGQQAARVWNEELMPVLRDMREGRTITAERAVRAQGAVQAIRDLLSQTTMLGKASEKSFGNMLEALTGMTDPLNAIRTAGVAAAGPEATAVWGAERREAGRELLGLDVLDAAIEQQRVAVMNVERLNLPGERLEKGAPKLDPTGLRVVAQIRANEAAARLRAAQENAGAGLATSMFAGPVGFTAGAGGMMQLEEATRNMQKAAAALARARQVELRVIDESGGNRNVSPTGNGGNQTPGGSG